MVRESAVKHPIDAFHTTPYDDRWGCHIKWVEFPYKIWGHYPRRINQGEVFASHMASGQYGLFIIKDIRWELDPDDMFWADVQPLGYAEPEDNVTRIRVG